ncbi:VOC family protein [Roseateles sp.]|jgi:PhnB protein|uniref:VOC family protein n=1 Tax=Roseateles sp. TaxID=1971397 RepID=UPI003BABB6A1
MTVSVVPHINLRGQAREALQFYQSVFGGEITAMTYRDAHAVRDPQDADRVMWGQVRAADGFQVMAYDVPTDTAWQSGEHAYFICAGCSTADEATSRWARLSAGASILQPLVPAPWAPLYGMLKDKFGVIWVVNVSAAPAAAS